MKTPSVALQNAIAYVPKPFAALSFFSSSYIVCHLLYRYPEKRKRMYHRIILAMNLCVLVQSFASFWGNWAIPKDTPCYAGAAGTTQTCTAQGFLLLAFGVSATSYHAYLGIYSYIAIKNDFQETKYCWIEKWIHVFALCLPLAPIVYAAANNNINPFGAGCIMIASPRGCEHDPDVECVREGPSIYLVFAVAIQLTLYFIIPPVAMSLVFRLIKKQQKDVEASKGMKLLIETARKKMLQDVGSQTRMYLFSFWSCYIFAFAGFLWRQITGKYSYEIYIIANCMFSSQGFILMLVYFKLPGTATSPPQNCDTLQETTKSGSTTLRSIIRQDSKMTVVSSCSTANTRKHDTVTDIRSKAKEKERTGLFQNNLPSESGFSIFDGTPSKDSPWAKYLDDRWDEEKDLSLEDSSPREGFKIEINDAKQSL